MREIPVLEAFKIHPNIADHSTVNSDIGRKINTEEDSPFFIKRRIRSSNPHARIKRKAHPMISKIFNKKMSQHGNKMNKKCANIINKSDTKEGRVWNNIYFWEGKTNHATFSNYWYIEDSWYPAPNKFI